MEPNVHIGLSANLALCALIEKRLEHIEKLLASSRPRLKSHLTTEREQLSDVLTQLNALSNAHFNKIKTQLGKG